MKALVAIAIGICGALLVPALAHAITDPDAIAMEKASSFSSVLETNDVLFIGKFEITYADCNSTNVAGCPTETVAQAFLGNLVDDDGSCTGIGTSHLRSVAPIYATAPDLNGYTEGVFSIYLTAADAATLGVSTCPESHALEIEGNPAMFADVSLVTSELQVEVPKSKALVGPSVLQRAAELESTWAVDLTQNAGTKLNLTGQDYFEAAIPNLQQIAPNIFPSGISSPVIHDQEFNKGYKTALEQFGVGTTMFDNAYSSFNQLATEWGVPAVFFRLGLAMIIIGAAFVGTLQATGNQQAAMLAAVIMIIPTTLVGLTVMELAALLTLFAAITLGYLFWLKNA